MKYFLSIFLIFQIISYASAQTDTPPNPYQHGEKLTYKIHYGFINAGKIKIDTELELFENKEYY